MRPDRLAILLVPALSLLADAASAQFRGAPRGAAPAPRGAAPTPVPSGARPAAVRTPARQPVYHPPQPQPQVRAQRPGPRLTGSGASRSAPPAVRQKTKFERPPVFRPPYPWLGYPDSSTAPGSSPSRPVVHPVSLTLDGVTADPEAKRRAREKALEFFRRKVPGEEAAPEIAKVTRLKWHKSVGAAASEARREHKPILYIQALGDIGGFT